jgi:hypothetical protein
MITLPFQASLDSQGSSTLNSVSFWNFEEPDAFAAAFYVVMINSKSLKWKNHVDNLHNRHRIN